jgi:hypothetical protein
VPTRTRILLLVPPNPSNSAGVVWPGFDVCPSGDVACPREVILEMYERWRPLSQAGWGETRDAWCREHNPASAKLD